MNTGLIFRLGAGLLFVAGLACASPTIAAEPCERWAPSAQAMRLRQNNGIVVVVQLAVQDGRITGSAAYQEPSTPTVPFVRWGSFGGEVQGRVEGKLYSIVDVEFRVFWGNGSTGYYSGQINDIGHIHGTTYEVGTPASYARWSTIDPWPCKFRRLSPEQLRITPERLRRLAVPVTPPDPQVCRSGFVWRVARPSDLVCVTPDSRARVAEENRLAGARVQPGGGAYGPNTCRAGFVWREAFAGDLVCVTPAVRAVVADENRLAASRRVGG